MTNPKIKNTGYPNHLMNGGRPWKYIDKSTMDIPPLPADFKEFLKLLNFHHVKYLVIGGYAVGYYGYPRATADFDLWVALHPENAQKLVEVLKEFGFIPPNLSPELFLKENQVIRLGVPPLRIELLTTISGVGFKDCHDQRLNIEVDGIEIPLISLEDLKRNKKASARHKDLDDLEHLPLLF